MHWVERVIAGYYDDTDKSPKLGGGNRDVALRTRTHMLLRPHMWRGQQNGARSGVVHARYMRPICEHVSSEVRIVEDDPANIVMFMPYLDWETERMRAEISTTIDDESKKQRRKQEQENIDRMTDRQRKRMQYGLEPVPRKIVHLEERPNQRTLDRLAPRREAEEFAEFIRIPARMWIEIDENSRLVLKNNIPLGQYLLDSARLYEAMSTFQGQQMREKYLYHSAPMDPRRTLDQSYYWTLKGTKAHDRGQVVYRGTGMDMENCHKLLETEPVKEGLSESEPSASKYQWRGHWKGTDEHGCEHCRSDIRKISQLIMVNLLWMWVLE